MWCCYTVNVIDLQLPAARYIVLPNVISLVYCNGFLIELQYQRLPFTSHFSYSKQVHGLLWLKRSCYASTLCSCMHFLIKTHSCSYPTLDMPAVDRLPLSEILQSSLDLSEADDSEVQRFKELRQQMMHMDMADLGLVTWVILPQHHLRAAEGNTSHRTHPPSYKWYMTLY